MSGSRGISTLARYETDPPGKPRYVSIFNALCIAKFLYVHEFLYLIKYFNISFQLQEFQTNVNTEQGLSKPVMIIVTEGGPDESPHYAKLISCAIDYFCSFDLDALYIATSTPGKAPNPSLIESRIVPLGKDLSKVIFPYEHFGQHYDGNNDTIDEDMERDNYAKGKIYHIRHLAHIK